MEKTPCIKCNPKLWECIKPYLEKWGYDVMIANDWYKYKLLVIDYFGVPGCCNNAPIENKDNYNRELVNDVEEFLTRAARLKGFVYMNNNVMGKTILNGVELKPGMVIFFDGKGWIVFPLKKEYAVMSYGNGSWYRLKNFIRYYGDKIEVITDVATTTLDDGDILWKKPKEITITIEEIAEKFGCDVSQIKIV